MPKRSVALFVAAIAGFGAGAPAAGAAENGQIFYTQSTLTAFPGAPNDFSLAGDIRAIYPSGTGDHAVVGGEDEDREVAASPDGGSIAYFHLGRREAGPRTLWRSAADGSGARSLPGTDAGEQPAWSPDGRLLAYAVGERGLRVIDLTRPGEKPRTVTRDTDWSSGEKLPGGAIVASTFPSFTRDSESLVYLRLRFDLTHKRMSLTTSLWTVGVNGTNPHRLVRGAGESRVLGPFSLSPDGTQIAYVAGPNWRKEPRRLFVANLDGSGERLLTLAPAGHWAFDAPAWSPDGKLIAVALNQSSPKRVGALWAVDARSGRHTVVKSVKSRRLDAPSWSTVPVVQ